MGRSGGILTIWDNKVFSVQRTHNLTYATWVEGDWGEDRIQIIIINIYAPCDGRRKCELWANLSARIAEVNRKGVCLVVVFNAIRNEEERRGSGDNN